MTTAFLIQLLASGVAVAAMVGLAAWIGVPRVVGGLTEDQVRALLADEHPELPLDHISVAPDAQSATAVSGERALRVKRVGDGHWVEIVPLNQIDRGRSAPLERRANIARRTDVAA